MNQTHQKASKQKPLAWLLLSSYLLLALIPLVIFAGLLINDWEKSFLQHTKKDLESRARLIYGHILELMQTSSNTPYRNNIIDDISKNAGIASDTRITVILPSGVVIADSHRDPEIMDNHINRPEIKTAMIGHPGNSIRYSKILHKDLMHVAIPLLVKGEIIGVLRTSVPVTEFDESIEEIYRDALIIASVLAVLIVLFSLYISHRISKPLRNMKEIAGAFSMGDFSKRLEIPYAEELASLSRAINHMADKLENQFNTIADRQNQLMEYAITDPLTNIANRRRFDEKMENEWKRMLRDKEPLSLILCDIDCFKQFNDRYGHQHGDECLYTIAQTITKVCNRPADLVARYGGEEFAIILPNTGLEGAVIIAESIRKAVMDLQLPHAGSNLADIVTLSAGVTSLIPDESTEMRDMIVTVDIALYDAKHQGRNRVSSKLYQPRESS